MSDCHIHVSQLKTSGTAAIRIDGLLFTRQEAQQCIDVLTAILPLMKDASPGINDQKVSP